MTQVLYAAPADLRDSTGNVELVQVATPENVTPLLDPVQMDATIASPPGSGNYALAYANILAALTRASAIIDTRLRNRYTLPLTFIPPVLIDYCVAIARFDLHRDQATDEIRYRYEQALKDLNAIAAETLNIGAIGTGGDGTTGPGVQTLFANVTPDNTYASLACFDNVWPGGGGSFAGCCR